MLKRLIYSFLVVALAGTAYLVGFNDGHKMGYFNGVFDANFRVGFDSWKFIEEYVSAKD
jgi:hypothetical protein